MERRIVIIVGNSLFAETLSIWHNHAGNSDGHRVALRGIQAVLILHLHGDRMLADLGRVWRPADKSGVLVDRHAIWSGGQAIAERIARVGVAGLHGIDIRFVFGGDRGRGRIDDWSAVGRIDGNVDTLGREQAVLIGHLDNNAAMRAHLRHCRRPLQQTGSRVDAHAGRNTAGEAIGQRVARVGIGSDDGIAIELFRLDAGRRGRADDRRVVGLTDGNSKALRY